MSERYVDRLDSELGAVGIHGVRRRRILAETADHLRESGGPARFGEPKLIAARFADELAASGARQAAYASFVALAPAGILYVALFSFARAGPGITSAHSLPLGLTAASVMLLAPQIAFAAAVLAVAGAWRLRAETRTPAAAISVLRRRAAVALGSGAAALAAVDVFVLEYSSGQPGWWTTAALIATGAALLPLAGAAAKLAATARLHPQAPGPAGDVFDDFGPVLDRIPLGLRGRPWRFCLLFAGGVASIALLGGGLDEGPRNAVGEFVAICATFAVLGRFLGLVAKKPSPPLLERQGVEDRE